MPELPEVEALTRGLSERAVGHRIERCQLGSFSALKTVEPALSELVGRSVGAVERRGKFVVVEADGLWLVCHLALGGWVRWHPVLPATPVRPNRSPIVLRVGLDDGAGFDVTEMGTEKRLALWLVHDPEEVGPLAALGIDPLDPAFTVDRLAELLGAGTSTLKTILTDQSLLAGVGNAYSDEALHRAKLSPFRKGSSLDAEGVAALHQALRSILTEAVDRASVVDLAELKGDKKRAMQVHGRTGLPCPVCGDTIRRVAYATRSMQYCPTCQTGGKVLADRRLSRLLK